jgi:hypothetical protein
MVSPSIAAARQIGLNSRYRRFERRGWPPVDAVNTKPEAPGVYRALSERSEIDAPA